MVMPITNHLVNLNQGSQDLVFNPGTKVTIQGDFNPEIANNGWQLDSICGARASKMRTIPSGEIADAKNQWTVKLPNVVGAEVSATFGRLRNPSTMGGVVIKMRTVESEF